MTLCLALAPLAYALGTFPSAVLVARARGVDITAAGSGNPGASNVARVMGARWGVVVFVLDALKGAIPAAVGLLAHCRGGAYVLVAAAMLGHMFPAWRRFRGGKGAATFGGAILVLFPLLGAGLLAGWVALRKLTGKASVATLTILAALLVGVIALGRPWWEVLSVVGLIVLVLLRHLDNIRRLISGRELAAKG